MEAPYKKVAFALSAEAQSEAEALIAPTFEAFERESKSLGGIVSTSTLSARWSNAKATLEIATFLRELGLEPLNESQFFMYKSNQRNRSAVYNPHFDMFQAPAGVGPLHAITFRFNTLLIGDEDQELHWWDLHSDSDKVEQVLALAADGKRYQKIQVRGDTLEEKLALLGPPDCKAAGLLKRQAQSAFVRTDKLHALNWTSSKPRIIMTHRFTVPWGRALFENQS